MGRFTRQDLSADDSGGALLRRCRQQSGLSLDKVSQIMGTPKRYLLALEQDRWYDLPSGGYARLFSKKYAEFLGLPEKSVTPPTILPNMIRWQWQSKLKNNYLLSPGWRRGKFLLLSVIGLVILLYLLVAAWSALVPPRFKLITPLSDTVTSEPVVDFVGTTQAGTLVSINSQAVEVNEAGQFKASVPLQPGLNTLIVAAQKSYGQKVTLVRYVMYKPNSNKF